MGVFAVSVDKRREDWSAHLRQFPASALEHVWCPKPFFQDLQAHYPVTGTPYLALVDHKGTILYRLIPLEEVENLVRAALQK
jgi:hypothetical protein